MEPGPGLWRHRAVTRMRWMAVAVLIAVTAFGFGRIDGGDDGTRVRTERVRESAASDGAAPAPGKRSAGYESGGEIVEAVLARTADDGTLVRVLRRSWEAGVAEEGAGWSPPPQCTSTAGLEIGLATDDFVTTG